MDPFIFVTGMFRSGTTLLSRMLNAHPQIAFASDPYARLFKAFRNRISVQEFGQDNVDYEAPLDDYYFYPKKQKLMRRILETSLNLPIGNLSLPELRHQIAKASRPYSPKIEPFLDDMQGETFADLLVSGLDIIKNVYGNAETHLVGLKEVWAGEFAGHILQQFPKAKVVHMIRDPRATCASKNVKSAKYPWIFLVRQWRKLATFAWIDDQFSDYKDRVFLMNFESLINEPLKQAQKICEFLEIEFHENLVNPTTFVDGDEKPWHQNSSHFHGKQEFNSRSIDRWKDILSPAQIVFIENLCFAEMRAYGYERITLDDSHSPLSIIFDPPKVPLADLAEWIRPYSPPDTTILIQEMALEYLRRCTLMAERSITDDEKRALCLNTKFFNLAQQLCK